MNRAIVLAQQPSREAQRDATGNDLVSLMLYFGIAAVLLIGGCAAIYKTRKYLKDEGMIQ